MDIKIILESDKTYMPSICGNVTWQTELKGVPGKLTFNVIDDGIINVVEGNQVKLTVDGNNVFYGYVFEKQRNKDNIISVTAYDIIRYLKNKDIYKYPAITASTLIRMIAHDFKIECGQIEDTKYKLAPTLEDSQTLFDIIQNALDITKQYTGRQYVLFDDFGKLCLKNVADMKVDLLIDKDTVQDFEYVSSIGQSTYNKIKLSYESDEQSIRKEYTADDKENIANWGILQYYEDIRENVNSNEKAKALLKQYNKKTKDFSIKGAFGDVRVRAGSTLLIAFNLGDMELNQYMMVEKVSHIFSNGIHTMDLYLTGGEFID